jgi:ferredoxin
MVSDSPLQDEDVTVTEGNAPGPFVVVNSCIDCDTCRCIAPTLFARNPAHGCSYVCAQPETEEEEELMEEALECCPVGAIRKVST